jgi:hypothetical protein
MTQSHHNRSHESQWFLRPHGHVTHTREIGVPESYIQVPCVRGIAWYPLEMRIVPLSTLPGELGDEFDEEESYARPKAKRTCMRFIALFLVLAFFVVPIMGQVGIALHLLWHSGLHEPLR